MSETGKEAVRLCEHVIRQAFGSAVCVSVDVAGRSAAAD